MLKPAKQRKPKGLRLRYLGFPTRIIIPGITIYAGGERRGPLCGMLDSGANISAVSETILENMTASCISSSFLLTASGKKEEIRNYRIDKFSICGMGAAADLIVLNEAEDVPDIIIGMDIISRLNIEIKEYRDHLEIHIMKGVKRLEDSLVLPDSLCFPVVYKKGKLIDYK